MTEFYEWLPSLCILVFGMGLLTLIVWLDMKIVTKRRWQITLRDGTGFIGKKTWKAVWREGFLERAYQVIDSQNSPFKENEIAVLGFGSMLYRVRLQKETT